MPATAIRTTHLIAVLALVGLLSGCFFLPTKIDEEDHGKLLLVDVGETLTIRLRGNATTGYEWARIAPESLDGTPLDVIDESAYEQDSECGVGQPGDFLFKYRAIQSGTVTLSYAYRRDWEEGVMDEFSVVIWVR